MTAPDWATSASEPALGVSWAKLALMPAAGEITPRQLGPTIRSRLGRAASSICWRRSAPAPPASPKPAVITTAARQPRVASSAISPGTVGGGVAITASSGTAGRSARLW